MSYPRETKEIQFYKVTVNDVDVLLIDEINITDVEYSLTRGNARPTVWIVAELMEDKQLLDYKLGIIISEFARGVWYIWARVTSLPEKPIVYCGKFLID
jgi:hypothetical protein